MIRSCFTISENYNTSFAGTLQHMPMMLKAQCYDFFEVCLVIFEGSKCHCRIGTPNISWYSEAGSSTWLRRVGVLSPAVSSLSIAPGHVADVFSGEGAQIGSWTIGNGPPTRKPVQRNKT